ncbi:nitroreductase family protein [Mesorhizobium sp. WSM4904]|uniref:Acg family FMN-binding oxidoreductase n=1 Tax=Mesorhizobium sp. WSM4904 TaxID=3038545 RepID=UPI0024183FD1|nr:nitroreductase family protein [Mesorhizobium sp. WSM4904]WFP64828.1 nitroreductase family protein [Mesorhizobium sp. WSM4904]
MNRRTMLVGAGALVVAAGAGVAGWRSAVGSMAQYEAFTARLHGQLTPDLEAVVRYATLAANSHNTQPWRFRLEGQAIEIRPDFRRRTPVVDPDDHHLYVSLGCAMTNLALAAAATGRPGEASLTADGDGVRYDYVMGAPNVDPLVDAISKRQSTRAEYDGRAVPAADLVEVERTAAIPGVSLALVTDRTRMIKVRDTVLAGNEEQMNDPAFMRELKQWIRFNPRSAMARADGLFSAASGNPVLPTGLGRIAFDRLFNVAQENQNYARQIDSSAGVAIFFGERPDHDHWIRVGQACQRFALAATGLGLKIAFINQPIEVARLRADLAAIVGETRRPDLVMRFGYGPTLPFSPRRPVASVIG